MSKGKTNSETQALKALQRLTEQVLIDDYFLPLLDALGYRDYQDHGGPGEEGKDIIAWEEDKFGDLGLLLFQVRRKTITARSTSFVGILTSLMQCVSQPVLLPNGTSHNARRIYYVTPYRATARALASGSELLKNESHRLAVIDGPHLLRLIKGHTPEKYFQLLGTGPQLRAAHLSLLDNRTLMAAVRNTAPRSLQSFYVDIDFSLERRAVHHLLSAKDNILPSKLMAATADWPDVVFLDTRCREVLAVDILAEPVAKIELRYARAIAEVKKCRAPIDSKLRSARKRLKPLQEKLGAAESEVAVLLRESTDLGRAADQYEERSGAAERQRKHIVDRVIPSAKPGDLKSLRRNASQLQREANVARDEAAKKRAEQSELDKRISKKELSHKLLQARVTPLEREISKLRASLPAAPKYSASHNLLSVLESLEARRSEHIRGSISGDLLRLTPRELRVWLERARSTQEIGAMLAASPAVRGCFGVDLPSPIDFEGQAARISVGLEALLDSGASIALLGDAGSGKSTTLQMYARRCLGIDDDIGDYVRRPCLFVPLTHLVGEFEGEIANAAHLESAIKRFFQRGGRHISGASISEVFATDEGILMLDGLDEVIGSASGIVGAVSHFDSMHRCQVVVSSRMSGSYIADINLFAVSMLPFSDEQRAEFVDRWFADTSSKRQAVAKQMSLFPDLAEAVRSPLLLTVLCTLEDAGVSLPATETKLFEERARLLLGDYDKHKQSDRIRSASALLRDCCNSIAIGLHAKNRRCAPRKEIEQIATERLADRWPEQDVRAAVAELIDPCGVLVEMAYRAYGFGHLRFQEHFAASEILEDRDFDILPLLYKPWWKGVMHLLARMSRGLDWLAQASSRESVRGEGVKRVKEMLDIWTGMSPERKAPEIEEWYADDVVSE